MDEGRVAREFSWLSKVRRVSRPWTCTIPLLSAAIAPTRLLTQDAVWQRIESPSSRARSTLSILERAGSELTARGAHLVRRRGERETEIACTSVAGTGEIRDMSRDPAGLVFIAAEHGLFVLGPEVDALDPVPVREGAPKGAPTSVFVDARRRVWIATEEELGVIDPSFFWGRTCTREDGLPAARPYRLSGERSGRSSGESSGDLIVEAGPETWRYRPDRGPMPVVDAIDVDGEPWRADAVFAKSYGDALHVSARGRAPGGASFRYRIDGHHVWKALADGPIEGIEPGAHTLDVIAIDRDLNRSSPSRIALELAYPRYFEKSFVLRVVLFVSALVIAFALWRAHRHARGREAWSRGWISAALVLAFGGQILAGLVPHAKGWPFMGFSMYTNTYHEDSIIYDVMLIGVQPDGETRRLSIYALGGAYDDRWQALWPIISGGDTAAREWMAAFHARHPAEQLAGLQVRADRRRLTARGVVRIAPLILSSYIAKADDDGR